MKNLRKKHPLLASFRQQTQKPAEAWPALEIQARVDLCLQFIVLPVLEAGKPLSQELVDHTMPAAVDLERQAMALLEEGAVPFTTIRDLLEKTAGLFLLGEGE